MSEKIVLPDSEAIKLALKVMRAAEEAGLDDIGGYDVLLIAVETILERTAAGAEVANA